MLNPRFLSIEKERQVGDSILLPDAVSFAETERKQHDPGGELGCAASRARDPGSARAPQEVLSLGRTDRGPMRIQDLGEGVFRLHLHDGGALVIFLPREEIP